MGTPSGQGQLYSCGGTSATKAMPAVRARCGARVQQTRPALFWRSVLSGAVDSSRTMMRHDTQGVRMQRAKAERLCVVEEPRPDDLRRSQMILSFSVVPTANSRAVRGADAHRSERASLHKTCLLRGHGRALRTSEAKLNLRYRLPSHSHDTLQRRHELSAERYRMHLSSTCLLNQARTCCLRPRQCVPNPPSR